MERKVFSSVNPPVVEGEEMDPISIVETAGYLPADVQIMQLIDAGARLGEYRKDQFDMDADQDIDTVPIDPTRSGNFDLADGSRILASKKAKLKGYVNAAEELAAKEAESASKPQESASEAK